MEFPGFSNQEAFDVMKRDPKRANDVFETLSRDLGFAGLTYFDSGSVLVGGDDTVVLKIFPSFDDAYAKNEFDVLQAVVGKLPCPTPEPRAIHVRDGYIAIEMSRIPGQPLDGKWSSVDARATCHNVGRIVRDLNDLSLVRSAVMVNWTPFLTAQIGRASTKQAELGWDATWVDQIDPFIERHLPTGIQRDRLLHTEVMRGHFLVDGSSISGLVDFEPSMLGDPRYEFASVGIFLTCSTPLFFADFLDGYQYVGDREQLALEVMTFALTHRYAHFPWYCERLKPKSTTLEGLAMEWFGSR